MPPRSVASAGRAPPRRSLVSSRPFGAAG